MKLFLDEYQLEIIFQSLDRLYEHNPEERNSIQALVEKLPCLDKGEDIILDLTKDEQALIANSFPYLEIAITVLKVTFKSYK